MRSIIVLLALVIQSVPSSLTPGVVRDLTIDEVCATRWGLDRRHVTVKMRKEVFARYNLDWDTRHLYEVDHLIPRELGGADDVDNLWPELWDDAHVKDKAENQLHRAVCSGILPLADAQSDMRHWNRLP
jgi:hypothetical protein